MIDVLIGKVSLIPWIRIFKTIFGFVRLIVYYLVDVKAVNMQKTTKKTEQPMK